MFAPQAMAVACRYLPDADDAGDVLQESFIKIFSSIDHFVYRGEGSLRGWVLRIVANEALNLLRRNAHMVFTDDVPDMVDDDTDPTIVPPDVLTTMIAHLPAGYRTVLNLYVFEQKSHKEIGTLLGIGESSSASQYLRAKRLLAKKIKEYKERNDI